MPAPPPCCVERAGWLEEVPRGTGGRGGLVPWGGPRFMLGCRVMKCPSPLPAMGEEPSKAALLSEPPRPSPHPKLPWLVRFDVPSQPSIWPGGVELLPAAKPTSSTLVTVCLLALFPLLLLLKPITVVWGCSLCASLGVAPCPAVELLPCWPPPAASIADKPLFRNELILQEAASDALGSCNAELGKSM